MYKKGTSSFFSSYDPGQGGGYINHSTMTTTVGSTYDESNVSMCRIVDGGAEEILSFITYDDFGQGGGNINDTCYASNHYALVFSPFVNGGAGYLYVNHILL